MTDRELLELAAKAAGIHVRTWDGHSGPMCAIDDDLHGSMWMPLSDDGDALRLAVNLNIHILRYESMTTAAPLLAKFGCDERDDGDPHAATRRAIVRAAAEIGKELK